MRLENSFQVPAPPETTWALLNDVPRIVPCMPGAELDEVVDENTWRATVHVKLGPIALAFATQLTRDDVDEASRVVRLSAKAREKKGRGGALATIETAMTDLDDGTHVAITTDLTLQGAVAQYGRGVVPDVAAQLTRQFADCLARQLATAGPPPAPEPVRPVGGLRLGLGALWRSFLGLFRRG